ncbi:MAG TPA: VacJ family lipoprotein [Planctomycetota bacterium]|nr:VacJ family lipoprotein [Planctomycetota bacterium]
MSGSASGSARYSTPGAAGHRGLSSAAFGIALFLLSGCSTEFQRRDWSHYTGPGAEYFQREEIVFPHVDDPLEPANRVLAAIDFGLLKYVIAPVGGVYRNFVPPPVRDRIKMAGENLLFPKRGINNALQGEWKEAGEETLRFVVNSTIGLLGLFDPASRMGLKAHDEDFGQTFAKWGWKNSTYFFLPLYGPSTIRDGIGKIPDELSDPLNYYFPAAWVRRVNRVSDESQAELRLVDANFDAYEPARTLYTLNRDVDVKDLSWQRDESAATQTLDVVFLTFEDPAFPEWRSVGRARIGAGRRIPYSYWLQPKPSPLVYIVPGLGGHRLSNSALGLAEIAYQHGNSVVTLSNPTNWEFIANASTVDMPGYTPQDACDLHAAITAIDRDLEKQFAGRFNSRRLAGISMGAFQVLFIAAAEKESAAAGLLPFDVYVAMDVPVDLEHAMKQVDAFYNAPLEFPPAQRKRQIANILGKALFLGGGDLEPGTELPFTQLESEFLIGLSFRMDLQFVILQTESLHHLGVLKTKSRWLQRAPAFREASEYSYMEYMYAYVLPYFSKRDPTISFDEAGARTMFERCDLHAIADGLRANDKVRLFANENDLLLRPEDVAWLKELFGDRAHFFPAGGHLGNLHRKAIQEIIESTAAKADDATP